MIIFDTNAVNLLSAEGPVADIVRKLRASGRHRVAVPWMVMEEMAAHQAQLYPVKHQSAVRVLEKLNDELPWELKSSLEPLDTERLLDHWRSTYRKIFEVIETSGDAARRALSRETMGLKPAKPRQPGKEESPKGARDVAIWFSILEFLKNNPEEQIHFVTNNSTDFGDGNTYPYPLDEDVRGLESRLKRLTDFAQVVSEFTEEVSGQDAKDAATELLRSQPVRARVAQTAMELLSSPIGFEGLGAAGAPESWCAWAGPPATELLSVDGVTGHRIEEDVWYTANAQWLLYGIAGDSDCSEARYIACTWKMKVLFSSGEAEDPTVLETADPSLPDTDNTECAEILQRLKRRVQAASRRAVRDVLGATSSAEEAVAQHLSVSLPTLGAAALVRHNLIAEQIAASMPKYSTGLSDIIKNVGLAQQTALGIHGLNLTAGGIGSMLPRNPIAEQIAASIYGTSLSNFVKSAGLAQQAACALPAFDSGIGKVISGNLGIGMLPANLRALAAASQYAADPVDEQDEDDEDDGEQPPLPGIDDAEDLAQDDDAQGDAQGTDGAGQS
ncbi:PIN domain-containing protein [Streptomyces sp. 21So2-11]|uniref:PIN domain-containing protein n=1 Tax=Streptomyces sp. 21So2-11 TaxID=3144408 RepID=UPI00321BBA80